MSRWIFAGSLLFLLGTSPARAASWSLGTQLGISYLSTGAAKEGTSTAVAFPSSPVTYEPGLRVALGNERHTRDLMLDSGWFLLDEAGSKLSQFVAMASYQHVFRPTWDWSPFANAGAGVYREDAATVTHTSGRYGAGIGARHVVREDHGALRVEVRYDHLNENRESGRPTLGSWGLRFGFDLWM